MSDSPRPFIFSSSLLNSQKKTHTTSPECKYGLFGGRGEGAEKARRRLGGPLHCFVSGILSVRRATGLVSTAPLQKGMQQPPSWNGSRGPSGVEMGRRCWLELPEQIRATEYIKKKKPFYCQNNKREREMYAPVHRNPSHPSLPLFSGNY